MYSLEHSSEVLTQVRTASHTPTTLSAMLLSWDSKRSSGPDEHRADDGDEGGQFALQHQEN